MHTDALPAQFWSKVQKTETCWLWTGAIRSLGYGGFYVRGVGTRYAHRLVAEHVAGLDVEGRFIDHACHVRNCVNPDHLQAVGGAQQNGENRSGPASTSTTGVRGVEKTRRPGVYTVRCEVNGVRHYGGQFTSLAEAEVAAIALRKRVMTNNLIDRRSA